MTQSTARTFSASESEQREEDWSFADLTPSHTLWGPHGYHRYPAKFIPPLVRRIIERYSVPGSRVGDPFVGSATTGVEALRCGRFFYGSDIHPVAILISMAKCATIEPDELATAWAELEQRLSLIPHIGRRALSPEEKLSISSCDIAHATADERFSYWFPVPYRAILQTILHAVQDVPRETMRTFFLCAFSNILRRCSIWLSGSTKPQKDLRKILCDPVEEFRKQVTGMIKRNKLYWDDLDTAGIAPERIASMFHIVQEDARHLSLADESIDLLVTSPPYAMCYEYSEMHQLTQLWFEQCALFEPESSMHPYIGTRTVSRRVSQKKNDSSTTGSLHADTALLTLQKLAIGPLAGDVTREVRALRYYFQDMQRALQECARIVVHHKYVVLVVGDSYRRGVLIPTSDTLCDMAVSAGLELEERIVRRVPGRVLVSYRDRKTGRFSSVARSDTQVYPEEYILVFRRWA